MSALPLTELALVRPNDRISALALLAGLGRIQRAVEVTELDQTAAWFNRLNTIFDNDSSRV